MKILIVGDLKGYFKEASSIALKSGANIKHAKSVEIALNILRAGSSIDLILMDISSDIKTLNLMQKNEKFSVPIIACGINPSKEDAAQAIMDGAKEYIEMPPDEKIIAEVIAAVSNNEKKFLSNSPKMLEMKDIALKIAKSKANVLITGESGTGKEVMSRFIHDNSYARNAPYVSVNCAAIPENLLESELFGHEKGAFTGAVARRIGKFEEAKNGTILLDEISEIDIKLQAKLLRVLQERELNRVGGSETIKLDLRVIATSNRDLISEVRLGKFREDLFYRLNIINLELPSLKDRKEDIKILADYFAEKYSRINNLNLKKISEKAYKKIQEYDWPGNVRELENRIYRAVLLSGNNIEDFDIEINKSNYSSEENSDEKQMIVSTLRHTFGNEMTAANILGITIDKLKDKLRQYEVELEKV